MSTAPIDESSADKVPDPRNKLLNHGDAGDLTGRAVRGGATVLAAQVIKFALQFGGIAILSRLLEPAEFGVVAMVTAITGLAVVLKDAGLSQSTVQRPHITQGQVSALFWLNAGAGFAIFAAVCSIAPVITWFYGDPRLTNITIASSCQFAFAGFSVQHLALLNREMQFRKLALIEISSLAAGFITAIAMAAKGYGYWALVAMPVVASITCAFAAWTSSSWRPCSPRFDRGVMGMLQMGGHLAGFNIVNYLARNMDNSLIGWRWGAAALGFYSRSYSLFTLPINQVNAPLSQVAIAGLSRIQDNPSRFASYYNNAAVLSMTLTTPLATFTIVAAPEIIALVLGRQWMDCVPIFRWLGLSGMFQPLCNSMGWIYISTGRSDRMFRWGIVATAAYCLSFLIGLPFGARGVAIAYACAVIILFWPSIAFATRGTSIQPGHLLFKLLPPVVSAIVAAAICAAAKVMLFGRLNTVLSIVAMMTVMLGSYLALLLGIFKQNELYATCLALILRKTDPPELKVS